ncbi:hypothetical protein [Pseudoalteromonas sp.]|uniref:hypothetical protein n=1 Tax=Pseudoalteromonas sp. TaxID=53249 RepID=UPI0026306AA9|nr:hypothetical protein [Pseudoalteromonas sp.]MCP4589087.1 hypothetical protein [Pseudoalteromonas sp.]
MKRALSLLLIMLLHNAQAQSDNESYKQSIRNNLEAKGIVKGMQELPISKLYFVEAQQGSYIISADGRFIFEGTIKDVWHRRTIRTIEDVNKTVRTPVSNIGFVPEKQLATFQIGNSEIPRQGVAFVDPISDITLEFLQHLYATRDTVNWTIVLLPMIGGNPSVDRALRLHCASDRDQAKLDLVFGTEQSFSDMKEGCNDENIIKAMLLTDLFRIENLPHLIREDGLVSAGYPRNFEEWFSQE